MLQDIFFRIGSNFVRSFTGKNAYLHLAAILLTYICVVVGIDWKYFEATRSQAMFYAAIPAAAIGFIVPTFIPLSVYVYARARRMRTLRVVSSALVQSALLGVVVSWIYKAFTGRLQPDLSSQAARDISNAFHFGFLQHGVFWGWPSSHTTVAFATAVTLVALQPKKRGVVLCALLYALYIGLGVSVTIHWLSDFMAGALIGTAIGLSVAKSYRNSSGVINSLQ